MNMENSKLSAPHKLDTNIRPKKLEQTCCFLKLTTTKTINVK